MKLFYPFNNIKALVVLLATLILPTISFAGTRDDRTIEILLQGNLVLGSGASVAYNLGDHLTFGVGHYVASLEGDGETEENNETFEADFSTSELFIRLYFFENAGLYISGAFVSRDWEVAVSGFDDDIAGAGAGNYTITATWPNTGAAYGVGYNWTARFGLTLGGFLGAVTGGDPELKGETDIAVTQDQLDQQIDEIAEEEEFDEKYNTIPIVRFQIGYSF